MINKTLLKTKTSSSILAIFFSITKKKALAVIMAFLAISILIATPVFALDSARNGLETTAKTGFDDAIVNSPSISATIGKVIGYVLSFVGVIFLVLIIYAGFTWMLARGNEAEVKKAKDLMYDAIIGLIIIMSAYAITAFVGGKLTS